ncbi:MAG: hypothetical protein Q9212_005527 [Teloschistes hypoglaucus]
MSKAYPLKHVLNLVFISGSRDLSAQFLFADECFVPMLQVLTALDDLESPSGELNGVKNSLEGLLLQHVVIPLRETFENARKARVARDDETVGRNADELLGPLQRLRQRVDPEHQHGSMTLRPVAHLYSIIVKYTPLDTSRSRVSEKGWLQFMFDRLTTYTSILVLPSPAAINALKEMLKILLAKKVKLEIATLESILSSVSHVLGDQQILVDWNIISLCLKMDPDVFVVPTVSHETVSGKPVRIPNRFLRALYDKSYLLSGSLRSTSPYIHQSVLEDIFIPLIDGFIHARDLLGFIEQWITNLEHSRPHLLGTDHVITDQGRRQARSDMASEDGSLSDNAQTLWEHETLLGAVASHIETRLTTGQMDKILQNAKTVLLDVKCSANKEKGQNFLANLVIVDCILGGCTMENTTTQLSRTIEDIYPTLLNFAASGRLPSSHWWRVWRSVATINNRWKAQLDRKPEVCSIEEKAAWRALELVSHLGSSQAVEVDDVLQSCNFLLSVINNVTSPKHGEYAKHSMKSITKATRLYGESVCAESDEAEYMGSHQVKILRHCLPLIIREVCSRPAVLLMVNPEEQTAFFKEMFKCSILIAQGRLKFSVDLWQTLSTSRFLEDNRSLATTFRALQLDALLGNITYDQDNLNIDTRTIEAHAIESIHRTPLHAFDGKQRSRIFNHVAERLEDAQSLTPRSTVDSLKLLINSLTEPRRSMMLLAEPSGSIPPWQKISDDETAAVPTLFRIAFALDEHSDSSSADTESLALFKCLAQQVLDYQKSRHAGDQGDSYLSWFWSNMLEAPKCASRTVFVAALIDITVAFYKSHFADLGDSQQMTISDYFNCETSKVQPFVSISSAYLGLVLSSPDPLLLNLYDFSASKAQGAVINPISSSVFEETLRIIQENQALVDLLDAIPIPNAPEALVSDGTTAALSRVQKQLSLVPSASESAEDPQQQHDLAELTKALDLNDESVLLQLRHAVVRQAGRERQYNEMVSRSIGDLTSSICLAAMQPQPYRVFVSQLRFIDTALQKHVSPPLLASLTLSQGGK